MRRLLSITALALFLSVPVWAQRGGGHGGFGGHGGGFAGHGFSGGSHASAGHFSGGVRSGSAFSRGVTQSARSGFSRGPFLHNGFHNGFRGRFHNYGFRNNCYGYACGYGYPWWGAGYYDPWLWDWSGDDAQFDADYNNNLAVANQMNEQSLEQQQMLRQEAADGDQDAYIPRRPPDPAPRNSASNEQQPSPVVSPTVLVFRDQHQQEIQNYAIVGQTLWSFSAGRTRKIPLSDLDLPATEKANDDRGVTFRVPGANEGQ